MLKGKSIKGKIPCKSMPSMNHLLAISLGLVIAVAASTSFVYAQQTTGTVTVDGEDYEIKYTAIGIDVSGFEVDQTFPSLIVSVNVIIPETGFLSITLDRDFLDSLDSDGNDKDFDVLIDDDIGRNVDETPTTGNTDSRELFIPVPSGTAEVRISGTTLGGVSSMSEDGASDSASDEAGQESEDSTLPPGIPAFEDLPVVDVPSEPETDPEPEIPEETQEPATPPPPPPVPVCGPNQELIGGICIDIPPPPVPVCGPNQELIGGICIDIPPPPPAPEVITPGTTEPVVREPTVTCGPGTVLEDGTCVLIPVIEDEPVIEPAIESESTMGTPSKTSPGVGFFSGAVAGFVVAGALAVFIGIIYKANKR